MGTSKILIDGVGIDLTQDTVAANKMLSGIKAHDSNGDSVTGTIPSKAAATYTPTTTDQTIAAGQYLSGAQTVKGDANLIAANIRSGKSIFGVAGSLTPGITPSGTKNITENGTFDVTQFASAAVNVPIYYTYDGLAYQPDTMFEDLSNSERCILNGIYLILTNNLGHPNNNIPYLKSFTAKSNANILTVYSSNRPFGNNSTYGGTVGYPDLEKVELIGKFSTDGSTSCRLFSRVNAPKLNQIIFGGIGFPCVELKSTALAYASTFGSNLTVTVYVNSNSVAEISADIKAAAPWGFTTATIVYRNSTTGDVLT